MHCLGSSKFVASETRIAQYYYVFYWNKIKWEIFIEDINTYVILCNNSFRPVGFRKPIRNKNCHVSHVLLQDQNKMRNFCRRPCIWLVFALRWKSFGFVIHISGDDLKKKFSQSDTREISNGDLWLHFLPNRDETRSPQKHNLY